MGNQPMIQPKNRSFLLLLLICTHYETEIITAFDNPLVFTKLIYSMSNEAE